MLRFNLFLLGLALLAVGVILFMEGPIPKGLYGGAVIFVLGAFLCDPMTNKVIAEFLKKYLHHANVNGEEGRS